MATVFQSRFRRRRGSPVRRLGRWLTTATGGTVSRSARDDITQVSSQFAYNAFLATVPFLFIAVSLIGLLADATTFDDVLNDNDGRLPEQFRNLLRSALRSATQSTQQAAIFLAIGLVGALYLSANVMGSLIGGLDRVRGVAHRPWAFGKLVALGFAAVASLLVVATTLAVVGGPRLVEAVIGEILRRDAPGVAARAVYPIGAAGLLAFVLILYRFGPNAPRRRWLAEVPGALLGVALWFLASFLFSLYVESFDSYQTVYGGLAAVVIYLVFLFLTSNAVLIGAEVNQQLADMRAERRRRTAH